MCAAKPGDLIDERYQVIAILGSGGMGVVYSARELTLARDLAIKVIHNLLIYDENSISRFKQEADVLSKITHKNVIKVLRYGVWQELPYLVMERLHGSSLQQLLEEKNNLEPARALAIVMKIASGMSAIHAAGIVHRDLKPSNIFATNENEIKLLDFGLCKVTANSSEQVQKLTKSGLLLGSVQYMSPEMCQGKEADQRADIYAAGIILYEMLTGAAPFASDNPIGVLYKHINDPVPLLQGKYPLFPLGASFDKILQNCLAKDPSQRYENAAAFYKALETLSNEVTESTHLINAITQRSRVKFEHKSAKAWTGVVLCILTALMLIILAVPALTSKLVSMSAALMPPERAAAYQLETAKFFSDNLHWQPYASAILQDLATDSKRQGDKLTQAEALAYSAALQPEKTDNALEAKEALQILVSASPERIFGSEERSQKLIAIVTDIEKVARLSSTRNKKEFATMYEELTNRCHHKSDYQLKLSLSKFNLELSEGRGPEPIALRYLGDSYWDLKLEAEADSCYKRAYDAAVLSKNMEEQVDCLLSRTKACLSAATSKNEAKDLEALNKALTYYRQAEHLTDILLKQTNNVKSYNNEISRFYNIKATEMKAYMAFGQYLQAESCASWIRQHPFALKGSDKTLNFAKDYIASFTAARGLVEETEPEKDDNETKKSIAKFNREFKKIEKTLRDDLSMKALTDLADYINTQETVPSLWANLKGWQLVLNKKTKQFIETNAKTFKVEHLGKMTIPSSLLSSKMFPAVYYQENSAIFQIEQRAKDHITIRLKSPVTGYMGTLGIVLNLIRQAKGTNAEKAHCWLANLCLPNSLFESVKNRHVILPERTGQLGDLTFSLAGLPLHEGRPVLVKSLSDYDKLLPGVYLFHWHSPKDAQVIVEAVNQKRQRGFLLDRTSNTRFALRRNVAGAKTFIVVPAIGATFNPSNYYGIGHTLIPLLGKDNKILQALF